MPYLRVTLTMDQDLWQQAKELVARQSTATHKVSLSEIVRQALTKILENDDEHQ